MPDLKDYSLFMAGRKNRSQHQRPPNNENINMQQPSSQNQTRLSVPHPKTHQNLNKVRLSHKTILQQANGSNRLKRRISTAGTSKRFPKDFFKLDSEEQIQSKAGVFCFKTKKQVFEDLLKKKMEEKKMLLSNRRQPPIIQENQNTPKFHDPTQSSHEQKEKQEVNEFLILEDAPKYVTPFLSMEAEESKFKKVKGSSRKRKVEQRGENGFRVRRVFATKE